MTCADVHLLAAEAALGLVSGPERAALLEHLDSCDRCRTVMHEMTVVADALVLASPQAEPRSGFEQRVLGRMGVGRARPRWVVAAGSVAAAMLLVVAFTAGHRVGAGSSEVRELAMRTPSGRTVGEAYLHDGSPSWIFAAVPGWKDDLTEFHLHVTLADGSSTDASGIGSWGALVTDTRQVRSVALIGADGQVWCSVTI